MKKNKGLRYTGCS